MSDLFPNTTARRALHAAVAADLAEFAATGLPDTEFSNWLYGPDRVPSPPPRLPKPSGLTNGTTTDAAGNTTVIERPNPDRGRTFGCERMPDDKNGNEVWMYVPEDYRP